MKVKERVSLVSLGCSKNLVDSEVMVGSLVEDGYQILEREEDAEVIIVNTCSFIEAAKEESIETILELAELKERGNCRILVVTGCLPQRYADALVSELPEVDIFIGTGEFQRIVEILDRHKKSRNPTKSYIGDPQFIYSHETSRLNTRTTSAYVKISEGCSNSCSYCVIGDIRGRLRSRPSASIIREVQNLADMGVKEINLIGQDTTMYGKDLNPAANLEELLRNVAMIAGPEWIRIMYTHPAHFTESLIRAVRESERICNYVDLPIQHINDRILNAMNRRTTGISIRRLICRLREEIPDVCIRTSLIVGFPGETNKEFDELLEFIQEIEFDRLGVFKYSREDGSAASKYPHQIQDERKEERHRILMEVQRDISLKINRRLIGRKMRVLIEGVEEHSSILRGRIASQAPDVDGTTYIEKGTAHVGGVYDALITDATEYDLIGEIISR